MHKVLLIDSYDSYTYNLYQLILDVIPDADIIVVRNDQLDAETFASIVQAFDFLVIGPGPGNPTVESDIGVLREAFKYDVPILGVCLGFQLICLEYGAEIVRMGTVKHGQVSRLSTIKCCVYTGVDELSVTRYHSLTADLRGCHDLEEVAWVEDDSDNGHVPMSVVHRSKPYIGVQYHPESACSMGGPDLISSFLQVVEDWNAKKRSSIRADLPERIKGLSIRPRPLVQPSVDITRRLEWRVLDFVLSAPAIAELLHVQDASRAVVLDSAASPSRYAVVAAIDSVDKSFLYKVGSNQYTYGDDENVSCENGVWQVIATIMRQSMVEHGPREVPFWGGLIGYLSYESGVESIEVEPLDDQSLAHDINLIMATRSIVIDYESGTIHVLSSRVNHKRITDLPWIDDVCSQLRTLQPSQLPPIGCQSTHGRVIVEMPDKANYMRNITKAQEYLAAGESYELCLTAPTKIVCEQARRPWDLYLTLRRRNPSPYACYMRLPGVHMLSSSPERFLSWTAAGDCQFRPIKGTVRKSPHMTQEQASILLRDPKEVAENLMIVDLIRHDLHQIAQNVRVPSLMVVEEYQTVYQLVSVITGSVQKPYTGLDALFHALPPGSMTGAPKKRSVELLQGLEQRRRGLYSGVCGYLSICGGGDWSVIIRTAFRYDHENSTDTPETWWIGAGGAITALSEPEAEWEEMLLKLQSTLPAF